MVTAPDSRIAVLPPAIAAQIAAGEVIGRPANVAKELLENAIDARATRIEVLIENGGIDRIRVRDDGIGIPSDQITDAFERHATSKLRQAEDLASLTTLGFRGEALASIAAVSEVDITTRTQDDEAAVEAKVHDGQVRRVRAAAAAPGTTVDVRQLFVSFPARLRFLRTAKSETQAIAQVIIDSALAYPMVAFRFESDGRELLSAPGGGDLRDAVQAVHSREVAQELLTLSLDERLPHHPVSDLKVDVGEDDRDSPDHDSDITHSSELVPMIRIDGLIGPASLHRGNRRYMHLIVNGRPIKSPALLVAIEQGYRGLIAAGRHPVAILEITLPGEQVDINIHPAKTELRFRNERFVFAVVRRAVLAVLAASPTIPTPNADWLGLNELRQTTKPSASKSTSGRHILEAVQGASHPTPELNQNFDSETFALSLREGLPALRLLGQIGGTYLIGEAPDGFYLIDQHAAHERILYERIEAQRDATAANGYSQPLLEPVLIELSPAKATLASALSEDFVSVGWSFESIDGNAVILRAVPQTLHGDSIRRGRAFDAERTFRDQLDVVESDDRITGPDRVAASLACHAAVRAGDVLATSEQKALLAALENAKTPQNCPHGRPTVLHINAKALARAFGRT